VTAAHQSSEKAHTCGYTGSAADRFTVPSTPGSLPATLIRVRSRRRSAAAFSTSLWGSHQPVLL